MVRKTTINKKMSLREYVNLSNYFETGEFEMDLSDYDARALAQVKIYTMRLTAEQREKMNDFFNKYALGVSTKSILDGIPRTKGAVDKITVSTVAAPIKFEKEVKVKPVSPPEPPVYEGVPEPEVVETDSDMIARLCLHLKSKIKPSMMLSQWLLEDEVVEIAEIQRKIEQTVERYSLVVMNTEGDFERIEYDNNYNFLMTDIIYLVLNEGVIGLDKYQITGGGKEFSWDELVMFVAKEYEGK